MEIAAEDGFRIRSYRNGATAVEGYPERIDDILKHPARNVTDIPRIAGSRQGSGRYRPTYAENMAAELIEDLRRVAGVEASPPAGSLRRGRETVGDLDLLVPGPEPAAALERFLASPRVEEVLAHG